jgi:hypothetical protein
MTKILCLHLIIGLGKNVLAKQEKKGILETSRKYLGTVIFPG